MGLTGLDKSQNICYRHEHEDNDKNKKYCKMCDAFLCITMFKKNGRHKFLCADHAHELLKTAHDKYRAKPWKREIIRLYSLCYNDRILFGHVKIGISQTDIARLFNDAYFSIGTGSSQEAKFNLAVLPKQPLEMLCSANATLVTRRNRSRLLKCIKMKDWDTYSAMLSKMQLI